MPRSDRLTRGPGGSLVVEVRPLCEFRFPRARRFPDAVARCRGGVYERFLHVSGRPVLTRAWETNGGEVAVAAMPAPGGWLPAGDHERAGREDLEAAVDRIRHALGVDDDMRPFMRRFRSHPILRPLIRRMPGYRVKRTPNAWEAFAWAVTEQLIESARAAAIQRRIVRRWGPSLGFGLRARPLADVPAPATIAALAPAELAALDLAPKRAIALIKAAREVASGRCDPGDPAGDPRLRAISEIGPWTMQVLALSGRGDFDSLPAGDLAYVKLVGHLAGLGRRATVAEVREWFLPYEPFRGLAGRYMLAGLGDALRERPKLAYHPANPEFEAA
ncbi:MAG: DNA-3-methyladenine glycosylase 2 family protein [Solirubrobacterales bacterium]|nr:DNA-3-methyladenine glycosylase 2 family protein [Solirubrobacterales bacterium]